MLVNGCLVSIAVQETIRDLSLRLLTPQVCVELAPEGTQLANIFYFDSHFTILVSSHVWPSK